MLKIALFWVVWLACLPFSFAQIMSENGTTIYTVVQEMPTFGSRQKDLLKWLSKNLNFNNLDDICKSASLTRFHFLFVIEKDGSLSNKSIKTSMSASPECRQAVEKRLLAMLDAMPAWNAGRQDGKLVRVRLTLPVSLGYFWED